MATALRVLVIGSGGMGTSHARAYHANPGYELVGLVSRRPESRDTLSAELGGVPTYADGHEALAATTPDVVCVATFPDSHHEYVTAALEAGCHVFCEKPLAETVEEAQQLADLAAQRDRKLLVGHILRVHPAWQLFIERAQGLGKPLVMRMNLNQQAEGATWDLHRNIMASVSPIVDCGVHYVDVMCQMTQARPIRVVAMGARLTDDLKPGMYNYGNLQVTFDDGSIGWYEAGWGPMMSEEAYFVKDVIGPKGSVSIIKHSGEGESDDIDSHTRSDSLRVHHAELVDNAFAKPDELINTADAPDHDGLCAAEQQLLLDAITHDHDLSGHLRDVVNSLRIVVAADESIRTGQIVQLD
ncbi:Gfo/Idh/MocA family protein [Propionibacteriaceae bacterium Y2011]